MPEIERLFFADSDLAIQVISQKSNLNESEMQIGKYINRIIVMDKGSIVEDGKHDDLLRKKGVYYTMYKSCTDKY